MIVVDANILVYQWLPGLRGKDADALLRLEAKWAAPLLWRSEFRNILAGYLRNRRLDLTDARRAMTKAAACLLGGEHFVADEKVFELVIRSKCSAYDCEYVAVAEALDVLLITEDKALLHAFPKNCRSLTDALRKGVGR